MRKGITINKISNNNDLEDLLDKISNKGVYHFYTFETPELRKEFFEKINLSSDEFCKKYFYYNSKKKLHISESEEGYFLISTIGLVSPDRNADERIDTLFLSLGAQFEILIVILKKLSENLANEKIYDIDSNLYESSTNLLAGITHNIVFYYELFAKMFLLLEGENPSRDHKLYELYKNVAKLIIRKKRVESIFNISILQPILTLIEEIKKIPDEFRECFMKYNDNNGYRLAFILEEEVIKQTLFQIETSYDFIYEYYYFLGEKTPSGEKIIPFFLKPISKKRMKEYMSNKEEEIRINEICNRIYKIFNL